MNFKDGKEMARWLRALAAQQRIWLRALAAQQKVWVQSPAPTLAQIPRVLKPTRALYNTDEVIYMQANH